MIEYLESTHPDLAKFIQSICRCYRDGKLVKVPEHKVCAIQGSKFLDCRGKVLVQLKTGRNAPCVCGSGKKFKKCCGR